MMQFSLPDKAGGIKPAIQTLKEEDVVRRIWAHDHSLWSSAPDEITNRLAWLDIPLDIKDSLGGVYELRASLLGDGFEKVVVLGMGGSSLAPDVFRRSFALHKGELALEVVDTTHPDAVQAALSNLELAKTAFIIATKSGSTVETLSLFRFFYGHTLNEVGPQQVGKHFIAITDPGSPLEALARDHGYRSIFLNDPDIGGRYSALSYFGLVPAALMGIDVDVMLEDALAMRTRLGPDVDLNQNPAVMLGTLLGTMARRGKDKLTFLTSTEVEPFADWIEQLVAESTGKDGKGILPVVGEPPGEPDAYGEDRIFVHLRWDQDRSLDDLLESLKEAGHPTIRFDIDDLLSFGGLFYQWEFATAIAGYWLGINPFDQPNVESAKIRAKEMVAAYEQSGALPGEEPTLEADNFALFLGAPGPSNGEHAPDVDTLQSALRGFVGAGEAQGYIALQAYLQPTEETTQALRTLQERIRDATKLATTVGYGPRFLHSTGQLHKGDGGHGLFMQFTDEKHDHLGIPDSAGSSSSTLTFDTLIDAQAMGDRRALLDAGRRVIRVHLKSDPVDMIQELQKAIPDNA